ncbi:MFS transporter [Kutzneria kofuensis]|uniref:EmrB/QacA subfamily drug resistance transporter n=1 Tax=Kutzneria kofuensis TaxID=103725 RepID=A0A7W9NF59_9PSEU|nr:MFS transporter [Kutzneria kofuensis]MBB5891067.1 EmrB/QacA subfamily drug resistance transporter [Kutzneria kofuensis]
MSQPDPHRWKALAVSLAAGFMSLLDVSIVNVALPSVQNGLHASAGSVQWIVSGYALTFGLSLVAGGRLGDVLGRRVMFLVSLTAFVLTSALAGAAPNEVFLIGARLLQGLAAGLLTPQNSGLIQDLFRGAERGKAFGLLGATIGISTATGPVLGGLILAAFGDEQGWRWVFYVNVPVGVLAFVLALRWLPRADRGRPALRDEIDHVGAFLLGVTVLDVLLPIVETESGGAGWLWLLAALTPVFAVLFVRWERRVAARGGKPLLDLRLFTEVSGYSSGLLLGSVYFCGFAGIFLVMSLFLQKGLHYTPLQSGLTVTPFALGSSIMAAVAGRLVSRLGRKVTVAGLGLITIGLAAVAVVVLLAPQDMIGGAIALPLLVAGIGGGAVISPNTTLTLECVPNRIAGVAGGALQTGQRIGTAIGTAVLATVFYSATGAGFPAAVSMTLWCAIGFMLVAIVIAVYELRRRAGAGRAAVRPAAGD